MRRFTATQHLMAKSLDRKIELAQATNHRLLTLLLSKQEGIARSARLELNSRRVQAPAAAQ